MTLFLRRSTLAAATFALSLSALAQLHLQRLPILRATPRRIQPWSRLTPICTLEGIPPIPKSIADSVAQYTEFRGHRYVGWHPKKAEMMVFHHRAAGSSTNQLYLAGPPMGELEANRRHPDPVSGATIEPGEGQVHRLERPARAARSLPALPPGCTAPGNRYN